MVASLTLYVVRGIQSNGNGPSSFIILPLVIGILFAGNAEYRWSSGVAQGSHLITYVSGVTTSDLNCQRMFGTFYDYNPARKGYIDENDPTTVHIKYGECLDLVEWFSSDKEAEPATSQQAFALHLLVFEATKIGTNISNSIAECQATDKFIEVATYAGASELEANRMLDMYKSDWYPFLGSDFKSSC